MPLRVALAGTGYISKVHAAAAQTIPDVELTAVVNHRPESRQAFAETFHIPRQFTTVEELLQAGGVDALIVSTPNALHAPQSIAALQAGVNVMVEKPMAMNAAEAYAMLEASRASGALLMIAHNWRFDPEAIWLRHQVEAGRIGKVVRTKGYGVHVYWGPSGWFTQKPLAGGGAMADMGVHAIDTTRFLLGDPKPLSVYAKIGTYYQPVSDSYNVDDTGILMVEWENDIASYLESGWWQPHSDGPEASVQLYGLKGFAQLYPTRVETPNPSGEGLDVDDHGFPPERHPHSPQSMYDRQMAYFLECVRTHTPPIPGGLEGWINMLVVDAAYESARTGQVVNIAVPA